jgi:hypothetical protein
LDDRQQRAGGKALRSGFRRDSKRTCRAIQRGTMKTSEWS